jgi:hypothetical protein
MKTRPVGHSSLVRFRRDLEARGLRPSSVNDGVRLETRRGEHMDDPASESDVVAALRRGDEATFVRLVQRHQGAFQRIARVWVRDAASAAEVVQGGNPES